MINMFLGLFISGFIGVIITLATRMRSWMPLFAVVFVVGLVGTLLLII